MIYDLMKDELFKRLFFHQTEMPPLTPSRRSVSEGNVAAAVAVDGSSGSNKSTNNKSVSSSIHLEAENQSLKQQLAAKEEDCRMAALLGQSLLSEIEKVNHKIKREKRERE